MSERAAYDDLDSFAIGQTEPLTTRLKGLIREYPEGLGIVKELLQNADDSGARVLHLIFDWRTHSTARLPDPRMAKLQGPALLAFNDRPFTNEDFENIQRIGRGGKLASAAKTGRFGLGFNAVYNVTDWPAFITGNRLVYFDPHCSALPKATVNSPGQGWTLTQNTWMQCGDLLESFSAAGLQSGALNFPGTIFRLPFRTAKQAAESQITGKVFGRENVDQILQKLLEANEQLLLFLKNVEELHISEIHSDGRQEAVLGIVTTNPECVRSSRKELMRLLEGDSLTVLARVEKERPAPIIFEHAFEVTACGRSERAVWQIVSGLFSDVDGELIAAARGMASFEEKAVPWAGAAARVTGRAGRLEGMAYCSLPLPIATGLPVHLHGFFDLNSSRDALTAPGTQTGPDRIRGEWNQALLRHGVASAYASLLASLTPLLGESSPESYYALWPDRRLSSPFNDFESALAEQLAVLRVFRVAGEPRWETAGGIWVLPAGCEELQEPLSTLEEIAIPEPLLPVHVRDFLVRGGVKLEEFTPQELCSILSDASFKVVMPAEASRPCLRRREWLLAMLRFCLRASGTALVNVPLALLADGRLRAFSAAQGFVYLADRAPRQIFASKPEWFLDEEFARQFIMPIHVSVGVVRMTAAMVVAKLAEIVPIPEDDEWLEWNPDGAKSPNAEWLASVFRYLAGEALAGFEPDREKMEALALVPGPKGRLFATGTDATPLLVREELDELTQKALAAYEVRLVEGPAPLIQAIQSFADLRKGFIWTLTGPDVADSLARLDEIPACGEVLHQRLLDFLSERRWLGEEGGYNETQREKLRALALFPTTSEEYVALRGDVFRPANLHTEIPVPLKLLRAGVGDAWLPLYEMLGVPPLDRAAFIRRGLLAGYSDFDEATKVQALIWIRDHLEATETEMPADAFRELRRAIIESPLIRCTDGVFRAPRSIYDPHAEIVKEVLGAGVPVPDMSGVYSKNIRQWLGFFRRLGMIAEPSPVDIVARIDLLRTRVSEAGTVRGVGSALLQIYAFVAERWDSLAEAIILLPGAPATKLAEALRTRDWLPAERNESALVFAAFTIPPDRLYRPDEVCFASKGHLAATQRPIFRVRREPSASMQEALGFRPQVEMHEVLAQLDAVIERYDREPEKIDPIVLKRSLTQIYNWLKRRGADSEEEEEVTSEMDLIAYFTGRRCLWYEGAFWKPEHAFQVPVPFFGKRRFTVPKAWRQYYEPLGMRTAPEANDYINFIEELASELGSAPLPEAERANVITVFRLLGRELADAEPHPDLIVLSRGWRLVPASKVFSPDASWYESRLEPGAVHLLHNELRGGMERAACVRSLKQSVWERPAEDAALETVLEGEAATTVARWEERVRAPEFRLGLERLIRSEDGYPDSEALDRLSDLRVELVQEIATDLFVEVSGAIRRIGGGGATEFFYLEDSNTLCLGATAGGLLECHFVEALVKQVANASLQSHLSVLAVPRMLNCAPEQIDAVLTGLKIREIFDSSYDDSNEPHYEEFADKLPEDGPLEDDVDFDEEPIQIDPDGDEAEPVVRHASGSGSVGSTARAYGSRPARGSSSVMSGGARNGGSTPRQRAMGAPSTGQRRRDRVVTYVAGASSNVVAREQAELDEEERGWKVRFGKQAVERVCAYEREHGRQPTARGQTAPGYDVESIDSSTNATRLIEVKAVCGEWSPRGIGLSATQFSVAQSFKDAFWLYVVEHADEPENTVVHPIQNPWSKVTDYRFDDGWRALADKEEKTPTSLSVSKGRRIVIDGRGEGIIQDVKKRGALDYLEIALDAGTIHRGAFNPITMRILS